jgi:hypothetical protein
MISQPAELAQVAVPVPSGSPQFIWLKSTTVVLVLPKAMVTPAWPTTPPISEPDIFSRARADMGSASRAAINTANPNFFIKPSYVN